MRSVSREQSHITSPPLSPPTNSKQTLSETAGREVVCGEAPNAVTPWPSAGRCWRSHPQFAHAASHCLRARQLSLSARPRTLPPCFPPRCSPKHTRRQRRTREESNPARVIRECPMTSCPSHPGSLARPSIYPPPHPVEPPPSLALAQSSSRVTPALSLVDPDAPRARHHRDSRTRPHRRPHRRHAQLHRVRAEGPTAPRHPRLWLGRIRAPPRHRQETMPSVPILSSS